MASSVKVEGTEQVLRNLNRLVRIMARKGEDAVLAGAEVLRSDASRRAPRDTGALAESIIIRRDEETVRNWDSIRVKIGPSREIWYAHFPEYGTSKMPAKPYLRPALDENRRAVREEVSRQLRAVIEEETGP